MTSKMDFTLTVPVRVSCNQRNQMKLGKQTKKLHENAITRNSFTKIKCLNGTKIMNCNLLLKSVWYMNFSSSVHVSELTG